MICECGKKMELGQWWCRNCKEFGFCEVCKLSLEDTILLAAVLDGSIQKMSRAKRARAKGLRHRLATMIRTRTGMASAASRTEVLNKMRAGEIEPDEATAILAETSS